MFKSAFGMSVMFFAFAVVTAAFWWCFPANHWTDLMIPAATAAFCLCAALAFLWLAIRLNKLKPQTADGNESLRAKRRKAVHGLLMLLRYERN